MFWRLIGTLYLKWLRLRWADCIPLSADGGSHPSAVRRRSGGNDLLVSVKWRWELLNLCWLRWKHRVLAHDGAYTRTLQRAAARGKGWADATR